MARCSYQDKRGAFTRRRYATLKGEWPIGEPYRCPNIAIKGMKRCVAHRALALRGSRAAYVRNREYIDAVKALGCVDCGNTDMRVLEFDHRVGTTKLFKIAIGASRGRSELRREIAKCDVRCANCHRIITYERKNNGR